MDFEVNKIGEQQSYGDLQAENKRLRDWFAGAHKCNCEALQNQVNGYKDIIRLQAKKIERLEQCLKSKN